MSEREHELAEALEHFTDPTHPDYDGEFDKEIRRLRPDWFDGNVVGLRDLEKVDATLVAPQIRKEDNEGLDVAHSRYPTRTKTYPAFAPNEEELLELAKYWITWAAEIERFWFFTATTGTFDLDTKAYANRRLDHIADMVGDEAVRKILAEVENTFRRRMGDRNWEIFQNGPGEDGDEKDWDEVRKKSFDADKDGPAAPGYAVAYLKQQTVKIFPEIPSKDLAAALRFAAEDVEAGRVDTVPCEHEWQIPPEQRPCGPTLGGYIYAMQRCNKCQAMREHHFYQGDPGYEDVYKRAQEYRHRSD